MQVPAAPSHGLSVAALRQFCKQHCGRSFLPAADESIDAVAEPFEALSSALVVSRIIRPLTAHSLRSYAEQLIQEEACDADGQLGSWVAQATVFVSHAWSGNFSELANALLARFGADRDAYLWLDVFARSQHTEVLLPGDWSPSSVGALIGSVGHTVLFMAPWQSPEPLKRAWCCWEALCTLRCGGALELLCSGEASDALGEAMLACADEVFTGVLDSVDTKRSQGSVRHDRKALHRAFAAERGDSSPFTACDGMLREPILAWLLAALRYVRASTGDSPDALRAAQRAARSVSSLAHAAVEPESWRSLAEGMLLEVHAALRGSQGATSSAAVDVVCDLCQLACLDAERDERAHSAVRAEAVLRETLSLCETSDAATHDVALLLRWHLAGLLRATGRVSDADELLVALLAVCRATHGNAHPATLHALHALALLRYQAQRRLPEAEELFAEEVQIRCGTDVGENHTDKIHTLAACVCEDADESDGDSWLARRPLCTCGHAACWQLANVLRDQGKLSDQELVVGQVPDATALLASRMREPAFQPSCACVMT